MPSFRLHLCLLLLLIDVLIYVTQSEDISVGTECNNEVIQRIDGKMPGKCCKEYLQCHCIKALCRTKKFSYTEPCVGDHLYKQLCADHYRSRCPDLSDLNFAKKCPSVSMNVDQWGKTNKPQSGQTEKNQNKNVIITYAIAGIVVLLIVVSLVWGIIWWFFFSKRRKSKEVKSTASKRSSGGIRDRSKSKSKSKSKKSRGSKCSRGKSLGNRGKSNTKRREERAFSGSFNSRAMQTRKISKVTRKTRSKGKNKGKEKMQYTKLKMALR